MWRKPSECGVGNACRVCLYKNIISRTFKGMKTSGKSKFLYAQSFPSLLLRERGKKKRLFVSEPLLGLCEMIYRQGVLCTRVFTGCLANELGPYSTKKIITLALPLQPSWASVVRKSCKFWLNWTLIEAVFKWPVRRRETIQVVGLCLLQSPSIIAIILWKQTNKTSHWLALMCALSGYLQSTISRLKINLNP